MHTNHRHNFRNKTHSKSKNHFHQMKEIVRTWNRLLFKDASQCLQLVVVGDWILVYNINNWFGVPKSALVFHLCSSYGAIWTTWWCQDIWHFSVAKTSYFKLGDSIHSPPSLLTYCMTEAFWIVNSHWQTLCYMNRIPGDLPNWIKNFVLLTEIIHHCSVGFLFF